MEINLKEEGEMRAISDCVGDRGGDCGGSEFVGVGEDAVGLMDIAYPGDGKISVIKANGTDRQVLIFGGFRIDHWRGIAWSREGKKIAFTVGNHRASDNFGATPQMYVAASDGNSAQPMTGTAYGTYGLDSAETSYAPGVCGKTLRAISRNAVALVERVNDDGREITTSAGRNASFATQPVEG